jgi:hypothetical protein
MTFWDQSCFIWGSTTLNVEYKEVENIYLAETLNLRNLLKIKKYKIEEDDYNCVLCNLNIKEYTYHLLFQCPFSVECWNFLDIHWNHDLYFFDTIWTKMDCQHDFFIKVFTIVVWEIWRQRNDKIFKDTSPSFQTSRTNSFIVKQNMYGLSQDNMQSSWLN